jgi:hypothetical protein
MTWAALPPTITPSIWHALSQRVTGGLRTFAAEAGFRFRVSAQTVLVRADAQSGHDFVYAKPLQSREGRLRANLADILSENTVAVDLSTALRPRLQAKFVAGELSLDQLGSFQAALYSTQDPIPVLQQILDDNPRLRMFRIGSRERLWKRLMIWRMITELNDGVGPQDLSIGKKRSENTLITGLVELQPASFICGPLVARLQPLAAILTTSRGAEIALICPGMLTRPMALTSWPVGSRVTLGGPGKGAYTTRVKTIPEPHAAHMLDICVKGANHLLQHLTDPTVWSQSGVVDMRERWITWMSVRLGLDAVNSIGSEWASDTVFWSALRALGILQGIWEGEVHRVQLSAILDPRVIRKNVLPVFSDAVHHNWAEDVIGNYESALLKAFPGDSLDTLLPKFEELRHLVHGVGAQPGKKRSRGGRLDTLRALAEHSPNVQLLVDMAVFWWTALLLNPDQLCREGFTP